MQRFWIYRKKYKNSTHAIYVTYFYNMLLWIWTHPSRPNASAVAFYLDLTMFLLARFFFIIRFWRLFCRFRLIWFGIFFLCCESFWNFGDWFRHREHWLDRSDGPDGFGQNPDRLDRSDLVPVPLVTSYPENMTAGGKHQMAALWSLCH